MSAASAPNRKAGTSSTRFEGVTCPFCPLLCDDMIVEPAGDHFRVDDRACSRARSVLEKPQQVLQPRIRSKSVSLDEAVAAAADILRQSQQPFLGGLATDVAGMRAAVALAEATGGMLDHMHGQALSNSYRVLQSRGWMTTTLTEIRNRADLILFVGTDAGNYHRFYERAIWPDEAMFDPKPADRQLIYLGNGLKPPRAAKGRRPQQLKCAPEALGEVAGALNALLLKQPVAGKVAGIKLDDLKQLAEQLANARYSVIVWAPGELPAANGEAIIEALCNLIETLNAETRSSGFILGGGDAAATAANVCAWLTGYPLRVSFARGYPEYDPVAFGMDQVLETGTADSLLWLSTLHSDATVPETDIPTVVIADTDKAYRSKPDVFIPAGIPGVDHAGVLIRGDSVVSLPLRKLRDSDRPAGAEILQAIHARL